MAKPVKLHPTEEEIEYYREILTPLFATRTGRADVFKEVDAALQDCIRGWEGAPKSFEARVRARAKLYGIDGENLKPVEAKIVIPVEDKKTRLEIFTEMYQPFIKKIKPVHRKIFLDRLEYYLTEFDFNLSADLTLLLQLVMNEIHISEMQVEMFNADGPAERSALAKALKMLNENSVDLQQTLGITREQRQKGMGSKEGSVADAALSLDIKLKAQAQKNKMDLEREKLLLKLKSDRNDFNDVPDDPVELATILEMDSEIREDA